MSQENISTIGLDSPHAQRLYQREWIVERLGWLLIVATLLAGILGYLGPGVLGRNHRASEDRLWEIEHDKVQRFKAPSVLHIHIQPAANQPRMVLEMSREFTDQTTLSGITPTPIATELRENGIAYFFEAGRLHSETPIIYRYENGTFGRLTYTISINNGPPMNLSHFICP